MQPYPEQWMPLLDTQKITDDLVAAGVTQPQARVFAAKMEEAAHIIRGDLATTSALDAAVKELKSDLAAAVKELRAEYQLGRSELRVDIKDMTNRFTFIMIALLGLAVAILKLWP